MVPRPPLPLKHANPKVTELLLYPNPPPVKYQILNCQGKDILVGRLKIETLTDSGHAFILRRYDTGAVSLTTMFRAAFPSASDQEEKIEIQWVRDNYDLTGNNGSTKDTSITRLAGTWVSPEVALELGDAYRLGKLIKAVVDASPDPNGNYRRSGRSAAVPPPPVYPNPNKAPPAENFAVPAAVIDYAVPASVVVAQPVPASKSLPTPSPTSTNPPAKRRKESSPAPAPTSASESSKPPSRASPAPSKIATPRRSTRTKSPAPRSSAVVAPLTSVTRTPKTTRSSAKKEAAAPSMSSVVAESELTAVEEENQLVEDGLAGTELHEEDVREQQKLIDDLKKEREAMKLAAANADEPMEATEESSKKREREEEEEPFKFEFKEPEVEERVIATNRRVGRFHLEPRAKSFAWGVAAFAVGMGAVFLPGLF